MKSMVLLATTLIIVVMALAPLATAEVPQLINYQGRLTDGTGNPVPNGSYQITFTIYDAAAGGNTKWTSGAQAVAVTDGLFTYQLGSAVQLPHDIATDTLRWLGIKVGSDPEIVPRTKMTSVAYAYHALRADTADVALSPDNDWTGAGTGAMYTTNLTDDVGIGTSSPDYKLDVNGTAGFNDYLYHNGDPNTYVSFTSDQIDLYAGGVQMVTADETTQDIVVINEGSADVDFRVE